MAGIINVWDEDKQAYVPMPAIVGKDGRGIQSFGYNGTQDRWIVVYTDGSSEIIQGPTLESGVDGVSPIVKFTPIDGGTKLIVTDAEGEKFADIMNGEPGDPGYTPQFGVDYFTPGQVEEIARQAAGMVEVPSGSWNDLTDKPSTFPPASHNQAASTITAGTFAGQVVANSSGQTPGTALLRNSKVVSSATNPTVNGEINWMYE